MKKMLTIAVIVLTVFALMIPVFASATAAPTSGQTMWVNCMNGKSLNVRQSPTTRSRAIASLPCGTKVTVCDVSDGDWVQITAGKTTGYVMTKFLVSSKPGKYEITELDKNFSKVTPYMATAIAVKGHEDRSVGLRVIPNKDAKSIRHLHPGEEVQVIAQGRLWSEVVDTKTGRTGYVATDYLQRM